MKKLICIPILFIFHSHAICQDKTPGYKLPASFRFDYEVVQMNIDKKKSADSAEMHWYYDKDGQYGALKVVKGKSPSDNDNFVVFDKEGTMIIFDQGKKSVVIMRLRKLMGDFGAAAAKDSSGHMHRDTDKKEKYSSVKTGKTKNIAGYPAEEYLVTDDKGKKGFVWYAKVDFNPQTIFGFAADAMKERSANNPFMRALTAPNSLLAEVDSEEDGRAFYTKSISKKTLSMPTQGYAVQDFSNMNLKEMIQEEMKKKKEKQ